MAVGPAAACWLRRTATAAGAAGTMLVVVLFATCVQAEAPTPVVYAPSFGGADRLLTNEYTYWNPRASDARTSSDWEVTSGSLFVRDNVGWTGRPDTAAPNAASDNGTGSSIFRMTTRRRDFSDVTVTLRIRNIGLTDDGAAAPSQVDGVHLFLGWHSESDLYVVSLNRRDNLLVVKKKVAGGDVNGGTYYTLGQIVYQVPYGVWQTFTASIASLGANAVSISVAGPDRSILSVTDNGLQGPVITGPGAIGLRGDNCEFEFDDIRVTRYPQ